MKKRLATLSAIGILTLSVSAFATPITGTSTGTFTLGPESGIQVTLDTNSYTASWPGNGNQTSYLTSGTYAISQDYTTQGGNGVKLASLTWADNDNQQTANVNLNWTVSVILSDPVLNSTLGPLLNNLSLQKKGDTLTLGSLAGTPSWTTLDNTWQVSNFRYVADDPSKLNNLAWTNQMGTTETLWIEADISDPDPNHITPVPEPGTVMLLGAGCLGLAVYGKRRRNA